MAVAELATIGTIVSIAGTAIGTGAQIIGTNRAARAEAEAQEDYAQQEEQMGKLEFAAAQREVLERKYEGDLVMSRQQALAAASGGGASSPSIVTLMSETAKRARYGEETAMYLGRTKRDALYKSAESRRTTGRASLMGAQIASWGLLARGVGGIGSSAANYYYNQQSIGAFA